MITPPKSSRRARWKDWDKQKNGPGYGAPGAIFLKRFLTAQQQQEPDESTLWIEEDLVCYIGDEMGMPEAMKTPPHGFGPRALEETFALPAPIEIEVDMPPGLMDPVQSFQCLPEFMVAHDVPGERRRLRLAPRPEFRVEAPPEARPGSMVRFRDDSGKEVRVLVPEGIEPGDTFEVTPPTLMVRVPEAAEPGDIVKFIHPGCPEEAYWARVPKGVPPCAYFPARLPSSGGDLGQGHL